MEIMRREDGPCLLSWNFTVLEKILEGLSFGHICLDDGII